MKPTLRSRFAGDRKEGQSILGTFEKELTAYLVPKVPLWLETYHLTLLTIPWCIGIVLCSYLATWNIHFLWLVSLMILLQYLTDLLDGAVGRARNTGLVKWGFYMDHFLDYIFLCSILIGYSLLLPDHFKYLLFFTLVVFGSYMVSSFLDFAATNKFRISYLGIGPTEIRLIFIVINTLLIVFGKTYMGWLLPYILGGSLVGLIFVVYRTQREIWRLDMEQKEKTDKK